LGLEVDLNAKEAFQLWLELLDREEWEGITLAVKWNGKMNITEDELIAYAVDIMLKSGIGPKALPGFDAVEAVREGRT